MQRGNPEIQRRAQEVINHCWTLGEDNPILAIHDVGAGGLSATRSPSSSTAPGKGARFDLSTVPLEETGLAPKEIWCNESQERYVLAVRADSLPLFAAMCERERCPFAVVGVATDERQLVLEDRPRPRRRCPADRHADGGAARQAAAHAPRRAAASRGTGAALDLTGVTLEQVAFDVLRHPTVASKRFLVTIGDRTVGGLTHRDQMVGPWQVPVADCAVTLADFTRLRAARRWPGRAHAAGGARRAGLGPHGGGRGDHQPAGGADRARPRVKLSCNWMAACGEPGEDAALYDTVQAVGMELCPALGISVPVGKDSLSMRTRWSDGGEARQVTAPVSLIVTAFATLDDVRGTLTPQLQPGDTTLILVDLGPGPQPHGRLDARAGAGPVRRRRCPTSTTPTHAEGAGRRHQPRCAREGQLLAYHDRSDGGLWATVCEMAFAGHLRREPERRHAGHRRRRHRRQPRRLRRLQELGHAGRRAAQRTDARRRCSTRSSAW